LGLIEKRSGREQFHPSSSLPRSGIYSAQCKYRQDLREASLGWLRCSGEGRQLSNPASSRTCRYHQFAFLAAVVASSGGKFTEGSVYGGSSQFRRGPTRASSRRSRLRRDFPRCARRGLSQALGLVEQRSRHGPLHPERSHPRASLYSAECRYAGFCQRLLSVGSVASELFIAMPTGQVSEPAVAVMSHFLLRSLHHRAASSQRGSVMAGASKFVVAQQGVQGPTSPPSAGPRP